MSSKVRTVNRFCDITVYPVFCHVNISIQIPSTIHFCQDDKSGIAYVSEDAKKKFLKHLWNANQAGRKP